MYMYDICIYISIKSVYDTYQTILCFQYCVVLFSVPKRLFDLCLIGSGPLKIAYTHAEYQKNIVIFQYSNAIWW